MARCTAPLDDLGDEVSLSPNIYPYNTAFQIIRVLFLLWWFSMRETQCIPGLEFNTSEPWHQYFNSYSWKAGEGVHGWSEIWGYGDAAPGRTNSWIVKVQSYLTHLPRWSRKLWINFMCRKGKHIQIIINGGQYHGSILSADGGGGPAKFFDLICFDPRGVNNTTPTFSYFNDNLIIQT